MGTRPRTAGGDRADQARARLATTTAFRPGRTVVVDAAAFATATAVDEVVARSYTRVLHHMSTRLTIDSSARQLVERPAAQLIAYTVARVIAHYFDAAQAAGDADQVLGKGTDLVDAITQGPHKATVYKDKYEVTRILTDRAFVSSVAADSSWRQFDLQAASTRPRIT